MIERAAILLVLILVFTPAGARSQCFYILSDSLTLQADGGLWDEFDNPDEEEEEEEEPELLPPTPEEIVERPPVGVDLPERLNLAITQVETSEEEFPSVKLYVSALDEGGGLVKTLKPEYFSVSEEGIPAGEVVFADPLSRAPLAVCFVVDTSTSMELALGLEKNALRTFIDRLGENDRAAIVSFSDVPEVEYYFTDDKDKLKRAVDNLRLYGRTALYDAVLEGMELLLPEEGYRRALVVLTDGRDNMSLESLDSVLDYYEETAEAENKGFSVFTLGLGLDIEPVVLATIADRTGGRYLESPTPGDLDRVYREILTTIQNEYIIEYQSPHTAHKGQTVTVRLDVGYYGIKAFAETVYRIPGLGQAIARFAWPGLLLSIVMALLLIVITYLKITRAVWLTVMITPLEGKDFTVTGGLAAIGASEDNDVMLRHDAAIEEHHAVLRETGEGYVAEALMRDNPLGIGTEWVRRVTLRDKDVFWLGRTMIVFREKALRTGERHPAEPESLDLPPLDISGDRFEPGSLPTLLEAIAGPHAGESSVLWAGKRTYIGRTKAGAIPGSGGERVTVDVVLSEDGRVSKVHAVVRLDEFGCWVSDLGSTNGTFVDGVRVRAETPLPKGAVLQVGDTRLKAE